MAEPDDTIMRLQQPTDEMLLRELLQGRNLGANLRETIGRHKKTVTKRLNQMEDYDLLTNLGNGVYEITPRGVAVVELLADGANSGEDDFEDRVDERARELSIKRTVVVDETTGDEVRFFFDGE